MSLDFNFKHFGALAVDMGKSGLRSSILSILKTWPWTWAKVASGVQLTILDAWPWIWAKVVSGVPF